MTLRSHCGNRLLTMSMRMCSFESSVHGAHSRKTRLNSTHCNASHAFEDRSKSFRTVAFVADTSTAAITSQLKTLPIRELTASMMRLSLRRTLNMTPARDAARRALRPCRSPPDGVELKPKDERSVNRNLAGVGTVRF